MACILLVGLLAFWGQLATGAAACFSSLAPPPAEETRQSEPELKPSRRQIQIKRVKKQAPTEEMRGLPASSRDADDAKKPGAL